MSTKSIKVGTFNAGLSTRMRVWADLNVGDMKPRVWMSDAPEWLVTKMVTVMRPVEAERLARALLAAAKAARGMK